MSDAISRGQQITKIMHLLEHVMQTASPEQAAQLDEAGSLLMRLDDDSPTIPHNELSAGELQRRGALPFRRMLLGPLDYVRSIFHGSTLLKPGEQWTITMGAQCGFAMEFTMRMKSVGDCEPLPEDFMKGEGAPVGEDSSATVDPESTVPPPSDTFHSFLQSLGLRSSDPPVKKPRRPRKKKDEPDAG